MKKTWTYCMSYMESVAKEIGLEPWIPQFHSVTYFRKILLLGGLTHWLHSRLEIPIIKHQIIKEKCFLWIHPCQTWTAACSGCAESLSCVQLFVTPRTVARQAPLSLGFSRQEHWSGLPCPPPGDLPNPGIKPRSFMLQADSLPSEPAGKLGALWHWDQRPGAGREFILCFKSSRQHTHFVTTGTRVKVHMD